MIELTVHGSLSLGQFWPDGKSDADTTKLIVQANSFSIRDWPNGPGRPTHAFDNAKVKGRGGTKPVLAAGNKLTVRLQGVDAPELHYRAAPLKKSAQITDEIRKRYNDLNDDFRQHFAETATIALRTFLQTLGPDPLPCHAVTVVDSSPNEVFDTYGRFVGDVHIGAAVINQWLIANGWAYPGFYTSMRPEEIVALRATANGVKATSPIWKKYTGKINPLDMHLICRPEGSTPNPAADVGPVLMPKLFRRLVGWTIARKAKVPGTPATFRNQLIATAIKDAFLLTDDFLAQGASAAPLQTFPDHFTPAGKFALKPDELVFREAESTLIDANDNPISTW